MIFSLNGIFQQEKHPKINLMNNVSIAFKSSIELSNWNAIKIVWKMNPIPKKQTKIDERFPRIERLFKTMAHFLKIGTLEGQKKVLSSEKKPSKLI